jgi:hypothetical protein
MKKLVSRASFGIVLACLGALALSACKIEDALLSGLAVAQSSRPLLSQIDIQGGKLSPKFSPSVYFYKIKATDNIVEIQAASNNPDVKIEPEKVTWVLGDSKDFTIKIKAPNNELSVNYSFTIEK